MTTWAEAGGIAGSWAACALVAGLAAHIALLPNAEGERAPTFQEQLDADTEAARERAESALRTADDEFLNDKAAGAEDRIRVSRGIAIEMWHAYKEAEAKAEENERQAEETAYDDRGPDQ